MTGIIPELENGWDGEKSLKIQGAFLSSAKNMLGEDIVKKSRIQLKAMELALIKTNDKVNKCK